MAVKMSRNGVEEIEEYNDNRRHVTNIIAGVIRQLSSTNIVSDSDVISKP